MENKLCSVTKKPVYNDPGSVTFLCPSCGQHEIVRSKEARVNAMRYNCPGCGFTGPN
ncbi:MAG TPA: zinc finger domain-containing protein [Candidatus Nanoarchaeia archaeon]|nr:zinc finger domain-containing protein [Candidatus Nanoarchaeia archaeon]